MYSLLEAIVPPVGIEPTIQRLKVACDSASLRRRVDGRLLFSLHAVSPFVGEVGIEPTVSEDSSFTASAASLAVLIRTTKKAAEVSLGGLSRNGVFLV
jgi:hypothetical protein